MQEAKGPKVRQFDRVGIDLYINKIIGDEPHLARVRDLSVGGVYLYKLLEPEMADGTRVGLELMLPGHSEVIWALGEVVREEGAALSDLVKSWGTFEADTMDLGTLAANRPAALRIMEEVNFDG